MNRQSVTLATLLVVAWACEPKAPSAPQLPSSNVRTVDSPPVSGISLKMLQDRIVEYIDGVKVDPETAGKLKRANIASVRFYHGAAAVTRFGEKVRGKTVIEYTLKPDSLRVPVISGG